MKSSEQGRNTRCFDAIPEYGDSPQRDHLSVRIADLEKDDQPREKALKYGIGSLSVPDLFAIILRTGVQGYSITDMCRDMMKSCDNMLLNLERKSRLELMELRGLGPTKALQVEAVMEIVRRYGRERHSDRVKIDSPQTIYEIMRPEIGNLPHEEIWVIFLNRGNQVLGKMRVSEGGGTSTVFDQKKVLRNALLLRAEALILAHNHPSGGLIPSGPDDNITRVLKEGASTLSINLLDHIIVSTEGYYSYRDHGRI